MSSGWTKCETYFTAVTFHALKSIKSRHTSNILSATDKQNCLSTLQSVTSGLYSRNPRLNQFKHHDNLIHRHN